jgi:hypothetical protein
METFTGYIYKLTGSCGRVYIGSTVDTVKREVEHNCKSNGCSSKLLLKPLKFDIIDTRQYRLIRTLELVEQYYLDSINNINQRRAYVNRNKGNKKNQKRWRDENKEKIRKKNKDFKKKNPDYYKEYFIKYYEENKDKIKEQNKTYREENKELISKKNRKYREENKEKLIEYNNKHYEENKETINKKRKEKIKCECGCLVTKGNISTHKKSKKHIKLIQI